MAELRQGDLVVADYHDLTANELIGLLAVYAGRDDVTIALRDTWLDNAMALLDYGLLEKISTTSHHLKVSDLGHSYINNILTVVIEKEIVEKVTAKIKTE